MSETKDASKPSLDIQSCPNCGNPVLLGDEYCSLCGQSVVSLEVRLKRQPPNVVAIGGFAVGVLFALAGLGMETPWNMISFLIAFASIAGGGLYYAAHLLLQGDTRREKLGKNRKWW